jgi:hypothetical protein
VEYLARNKKADLSIRDHNNFSVYSIVDNNPSTPQDCREKTYRVLRESGVTRAKVKKGHRSPLTPLDDSLLYNKRLAEEEVNTRLYIRAMTLSLPELKVEAMEEDRRGNYPLMVITASLGMGEVIERVWKAWPGCVNTIGEDGYSPIMEAAFFGKEEYCGTLATMGADLSIVGGQESNVLKVASGSREPHAQKLAVFKVMAEHGIEPVDNRYPIIPEGFQSPLYFQSKYYESNVRDQRWMNRSILMMCVNSVYNWSVENQIEDERYRTLPGNLPKLGRFIAHCWFDVAGGEPDNGIGRLIMSFAFGFDNSKTSHALLGMPEYGKAPDKVIRCIKCFKHKDKGMLRCCPKISYCSAACQKVHFKKHKKNCQNEAYLAKKAAVAAKVASLR